MLPKAHRHLSNASNPAIFFDVKINNDDAITTDRVIVELFADSCPVIAEHLRQLFTGEIRKRNIPVGFKDGAFNRIIPSTLVHCSVLDTGVGLDSATLSALPDRSADVPHTPGLLIVPLDEIALGNNFQFYISLDNSSWIASTHLIVGRVLEGMSTLRALEKVPTHQQSHEPRQPVVIAECGEM